MINPDRIASLVEIDAISAELHWTLLRDNDRAVRSALDGAQRAVAALLAVHDVARTLDDEVGVQVYGALRRALTGAVL